MGHHVLMMHPKLGTHHPECWDTLERLASLQIWRDMLCWKYHPMGLINIVWMALISISKLAISPRCWITITRLATSKPSCHSWLIHQGSDLFDDIPLIGARPNSTVKGSFHLKNVSTIQICLRLGENQSELMKHIS